MLGRSEDCDLHLADSVLSQRHCSFTYSEQDKENGTEGGWLIQDGDANKKSLNGTWVYLDKPTRLTSRMTFKVSEILFEANLHNL